MATGTVVPELRSRLSYRGRAAVRGLRAPVAVWRLIPKATRDEWTAVRLQRGRLALVATIDPEAAAGEVN